MPPPAIQSQNIGKKYCRTLRRSMMYGIADIARDFVGVPPRPELLRKNEFWALEDLSLDLPVGGALGVIGRNGSGKTTLLKMLAGIFKPDLGTLTIRGRVGALIEIGAGFHPHLTGRENIFINGMILGMSVREIQRSFDEIVDFAEIGPFIDSPIKHYSSGMYVRLGFSVAIHAPTEILLIDEVLAVGDLAFAQKCLRKIVEFRTQGGTLVLVTHSMKNVKFVCDDALWLENGTERQSGNPIEVATAYEQELSDAGKGASEIVVHDEKIRILDFHCPTLLQSGDALQMTADLEFNRPVEQPVFDIHLFSCLDDTLVFSHHSDLQGHHWDRVQGRMRLTMQTGPLPLRRGDYMVTFAIAEREMNNTLACHHKRYLIKVENEFDMYGTVDARFHFSLTDQD